MAALYSLILGRSPEPSGLAGWVDYLKVQFSAMLPTFVDSPEFHALVPNTQDRAAVEAVVVRLYQQVLGRSPQPAEAAAWVDYIVATGDLLGVARSSRVPRVQLPVARRPRDSGLPDVPRARSRAE